VYFVQKKVVGVFVRFRAPLHADVSLEMQRKWNRVSLSYQIR
jgi:hypothetical protein